MTLTQEQRDLFDEIPQIRGCAARITVTEVRGRCPAREFRTLEPWRLNARRREYQLRLMQARMEMEDCLG
jgi:hypothetical protein